MLYGMPESQFNLSPMSDQHEISPNYVNTYTTKKVVRIDKLITRGDCFASLLTNSLNYAYMHNLYYILNFGVANIFQEKIHLSKSDD